jgi:hypothetical protein
MEALWSLAGSLLPSTLSRIALRSTPRDPSPARDSDHYHGALHYDRRREEEGTRIQFAAPQVVMVHYIEIISY